MKKSAKYNNYFVLFAYHFISSLPVLPDSPFFLFLPVLEEVFQSLADGVPLLDSQQVLQLLSEGPALNPDAGGQNLCHPLQ